MEVKIGHASIDERKKAKGGAAGDNNSREVFTRDYYVHPKKWVVLRCKDVAKREKIAKAMEMACANNDIGYDQNQRDTLFNNVKDKGFDPSKTTKKVETDCSALVRVCIAYAFGKDVAGNIRTVSEPATLVKTGLFTKYTSDKYCKSSDYLMRGDILCTPTSGHTVVVLTDGPKAGKTTKPKTTATKKTVKATDAAKSYLESLSGTYKTTTALNVRNGAGTMKKVMVTIPKGTKVDNFGYYTSHLGKKWLYVQFTYKGTKYIGFCHSKYLDKQ